MRVAIINDIFSFKLASGIYVWYFHFIKMLKELGITEIDMICPVREEKFHGYDLIKPAYANFEGLGVEFHFSSATTLISSYETLLDDYLEKHRPDLIISCNAEELLYKKWDTKGIPIAIYQHTGRHIYKDVHILDKAYAMQDNVHSICISDLAGSVLEHHGHKHTVQLQPYYPARKAKESSREYMITLSGGYECKRDDLSIEICDRIGAPLKGLGRHPQFELVNNDDVYKYLEKARCMIHMSYEDMVPYAFLEAAQYCNIICDVHQTWVHGLRMYSLPVWRVDPADTKQIRTIYDMELTKVFDPEEHRERFLDGWRKYFSGMYCSF